MATFYSVHFCILYINVKNNCKFKTIKCHLAVLRAYEYEINAPQKLWPNGATQIYSYYYY